MNSVHDFVAVEHALVAAGIEVKRNVSLAPMTTYGVGGTAALAVSVSDINSCEFIGQVLSRVEPIPLAIIGRGSNTLIADEGFSGLAIVINSAPRDTSIHLDDDCVTVPASMTMPVLARRTVGLGRGGLEWCVGIPGSVGGAVRMNAGGHGAEMVDSLISARIVSCVSGVVADIDAADLGLHFRGSALAQHHLVLSAQFSTTQISVSDGEKLIDDIVKWRRDNQPGGRNAGSVFVNPSPGSGSAGALIDAAGLRGYRCGGATVSEKHANFIQAEHGALAADVVAVMSHVQHEVQRHSGTTLRSEVCLLGFSPLVTQQFSDPVHHEPERIAARETLRTLLGEAS